MKRHDFVKHTAALGTALAVHPPLPECVTTRALTVPARGDFFGELRADDAVAR